MDSKNLQGQSALSFCLILYLIGNTVVFLSSISEGYIHVEGVSYYLSDKFTYCSVYAISISALIATYYLSKKSAEGTILKLETEQLLTSKVSFSVLTIQLLFLAYSIALEANIAGKATQQDSPLRFLFYIFPADMIAIFYFCFAQRCKLTTINIAVFCVSMMSRGWSGFIFILLIIFLSRTDKGILSALTNNKYSGRLFIIITALILLSPIITSFKFWIRLTDSSVLFSEHFSAYIYEEGYWGSVISEIYSLIERFSIVNYAYSIHENSELLRHAYESCHVIPYWAEFSVTNLISKYLLECGNTSISNYSVQYGLGYYGATWNMSVGIPGWWFILSGVPLVFFMLFSIFSIFLTTRLSGGMGRSASIVAASFSLIYFYHGWIASYFLIINSFIFYYAISKIGKRSIAIYPGSSKNLTLPKPTTTPSRHL